MLVPKDSPIKTVAELKGKKVAYAKGSNSNYFAVKALEKYGVKYGEFEPVHLAPADARAAFESGKVDAWSIWDPYFASAEATAGARVLTTGEGIVANHQFYLAGKTYAESNGKAIDVVLNELKASRRLGQGRSQGRGRAALPADRHSGADPRSGFEASGVRHQAAR